MSGSGDTTRLHPQALVVSYGERTYVIPPEFGGLFAIGRGSSCQIVLDSATVSRLHGCISVAGDTYVYRDTSSNGTILVNGHDEFLLQDAQATLPDRGALKIGNQLLSFQRRST